MITSMVKTDYSERHS